MYCSVALGKYGSIISECLITSGKNIKCLLIDCKQQKCIGYDVYVKQCCASTVSSPIPFVGVVRQAFGVGPPRLWRD